MTDLHSFNEKTGANEKVQPQVPNAMPSSHEGKSVVNGLGALVVDLAVMSLVAVLVSLAAWLYLPKILGSTAEVVHIEDVVVTVNFEAITREQIMALSEQVRAGEIEPSQMPALSKAFTEGLLAKIRQQADQGKIVLRSENVLAAPDAVADLTARFRAELQKEGLMASQPKPQEPQQDQEQK